MTNYVLVALFCLGESVPSSFVLAETTIQQLCYPSMGISGSCEQGASVAALLLLAIHCCCCSITHHMPCFLRCRRIHMYSRNSIIAFIKHL